MRINYTAITSKILSLNFTTKEERRITATGCHEIAIQRDTNQINVSIVTKSGQIQQFVTFRMSYDYDLSARIHLRGSEFIMGSEGIKTSGCHVEAMQLRGEAAVILSEVAEILLSSEVQEHIIDELNLGQRVRASMVAKREEPKPAASAKRMSGLVSWFAALLPSKTGAAN